MSDARPTGIMRAGWMAHDGYTSHVAVVDAAFTNELGNEIKMTVIEDEGSILVQAVGPDSEVEHRWTIVEANRLYELLGQVLN